MGKCAACGTSDDLTRTCNYCGKEVCSSHILPEKHNCASVRPANNAGKHFESAFEATLGEANDPENDSPEPMDKGKVRTYGTAEAVENLDSSPPVETRPDDELDKELDQIRRRTRVKATLGRVTSPVRRFSRWTKSKFSRSRTRTYGPKNRSRRKALLALGSASLLSTGWLSVHNGFDFEETVEDLAATPERLTTGGTNGEGAKAFAASENFERVSWGTSDQSAQLVVEIPKNHTMDWFHVEASASLGSFRPLDDKQMVVRQKAPTGGGEVRISLFDDFVENSLPSGKWRLVAHKGPVTEDADVLGYVVWEVGSELKLKGVPTIDTRDFTVEIGVENTGNAPVLVKEMFIDDLDPVPVGGFNFLTPGETGTVKSLGTPFREGCMPDSYTLEVTGTPSSGDYIDIASDMGDEDC